jgi:hypothetical protein
MMPLSLLKKPGDHTKLAILLAFFHTTGDSQTIRSYENYFNYYEHESKRLWIGIAPQFWPATRLAAKTHEDILHIAGSLAGRTLWTRPQLREHLQLYFRDAEDLAIDYSINLALRLWLMLNVRDVELGVQTLQKPAIQWDDASTLEDFVASQFPPSNWPLAERKARLDPFFTAANMVRICGLKLEWTESLEDHLRLDRRAKVLSIYPYKNCLVRHLNSLNCQPGDTKR